MFRACWWRGSRIFSALTTPRQSSRCAQAAFAAHKYVYFLLGSFHEQRPNMRLQILKCAKARLQEGGPLREIHTLPPVVIAALRLVKRCHGMDDNGGVDASSVFHFLFEVGSSSCVFLHSAMKYLLFVQTRRPVCGS